jgi:hypothetical protein
VTGLRFPPDDFVAPPPEDTLVYPLPDTVSEWLGKLRRLEGVPFRYLVPDERLLPPESIRFFVVDRQFTDALVDGAISVAATIPTDQERLAKLHADMRDQVDFDESRLGHPPRSAPPSTLTGFLLRSRLVSVFPGLHVSASSLTDVLPVVRLERLAPAILVAIIAGVPDVITLTEPASSLHFDLEDTNPSPTASTWVVRYWPIRNPNVIYAESDVPQAALADVAFRAGTSRVVDVVDLAGKVCGGTVDSARLAAALVARPREQTFSRDTP